LGVECDFINYWKNNGNTIRGRIVNFTRGRSPLVKILMSIILYPSFKKDSKVFDIFNRRNLHILPGEYTCEEDLEQMPINSDIYCTGSDQTWNSSWNNGILPELFLKFVPNNIKKISYAASIGKSSLDEWEIEDMRLLLSRYSSISVRENSAVDICKAMGLNATLVLDPTLQVTRDFWMSIASPRIIKEKYVLVYQLNTNSLFDKYAVEYAKRRKCKLIRFCIRHYQALRPGKALVIPKPEDFLSAIAYADTVITDSFHATAFSCNLNVPMICIYPKDFSDRLSSLLDLTGLKSRHLQSFDDFSFVNNHDVDFSPVNRILDIQRQIGIDYLTKAIFD
jgi:hypothetical protein